MYEELKSYFKRLGIDIDVEKDSKIDMRTIIQNIKTTTETKIVSLNF